MTEAIKPIVPQFEKCGYLLLFFLEREEDKGIDTNLMCLHLNKELESWHGLTGSALILETKRNSHSGSELKHQYKLILLAFLQNLQTSFSSFCYESFITFLQRNRKEKKNIVVNPTEGIQAKRQNYFSKWKGKHTAPAPDERKLLQHFIFQPSTSVTSWSLGTNMKLLSKRFRVTLPEEAVKTLAASTQIYFTFKTQHLLRLHLMSRQPWSF